LAPNDELLTEGDTLHQFQLADTLEAIAEQGIDYFYNSNFTVEMVKELQETYGSILTVEDFQRYTAIERQVVSARFKDHIMLSMPPPASGAILGLLLNTLDGM
jgi:gamma-glutamyltranspeptidase/glutathione hydrolase/leukotriene-C4 hydrolase